MPAEIGGVGSFSNPALANRTGNGEPVSPTNEAAESNRTEIARSQEESRLERQEVRNFQTQQNQDRNFVSDENVGGTINTFA
jgi:hypothetical protein